MAALESHWLSLKQAATYAGRGRRFLAREIHAGRLRAAIIGGRREYVTTAKWIDEWYEGQAQPLEIVRRRA